jgi:hypothetical protein
MRDGETLLAPQQPALAQRKSGHISTRMIKRSAARGLPNTESRPAASSPVKCTRSKRTSDRGVGGAFAHSVIEGLRLGIGRYSEEAR